MRYFVSGHRDLTPEEFEEHYALLIYGLIMEDTFAEFYVGDWEGCDSMFMDYIEDNFVDTTVHIVCVDSPRLSINPDSKNKLIIHKYNTYDECDSAMTHNTQLDIAWVRPGKENSHTALNIKRRYNL